MANVTGKSFIITHTPTKKWVREREREREREAKKKSKLLNC